MRHTDCSRKESTNINALRFHLSTVYMTWAIPLDPYDLSELGKIILRLSEFRRTEM